MFITCLIHQLFFNNFANKLSLFGEENAVVECVLINLQAAI